MPVDDLTGLKVYARNLDLLVDKKANLFDLFQDGPGLNVALSAANLIAMFTTPVEIIPAPGAGKYIVVEQIVLEMTRSATAFTGGGVVTFQYAAGAVVHSGSIPAAVINGGAGVVHTLLAPNTTANGITVPENTAVTITNGTAAFATGTGTAIAKIWYRIVTVG